MMVPETNTKQKALALLTVFFLFTSVGYLFFTISLDNTHRTKALVAKVRELEKDERLAKKLDSLGISTSTLPVTSQAYLTLAVTDKGQKKILQQKNPDFSLPIASVTKLMTAIIAVENSRLQTEMPATKEYIGLEESAFILETGHVYSVKELVANMLVSSDNDSARLLSGLFGETDFIAKMNAKAGELRLDKTHFINVTGLDPIKPALEMNISSPNDLATLLLYIKDRHPEILKLTSNSAYDFCDVRKYCKTVNGTNKLLTDPNFKYRIVGGKTGSTNLALKNLAVMIKIDEDISLINVVLGSKDNFLDTANLINNVIIK